MDSPTNRQMYAEVAAELVNAWPADRESTPVLRSWLPGNWMGSASAGVVGLALAGPVGGLVGVVNSLLTGPEAGQVEESMVGPVLGQAAHYTLATGLVVVCVAGGHVLLGTAAIAGCGVNAAQYMMEEPAVQSQDGQADDEKEADKESVAESLQDDVLSEEEDEVAKSSWLSSWPCFAGCAGWMFSSREPSQTVDVDGEEQSQRLVRRSRQNLRQRQREMDVDTSFLLFETTHLPKPKIQRRCKATSLRPVTPLALNNKGQEAVVNEYFTGHVLMMHRPMPKQQTPIAYPEYFAKKTRRWELRLQGRFHKRPNGKLYMGVVLRDFDYSVPLSFFTSWLSTLSIKPLEYVVGSNVTLNFGDREEAALKDDAMLAQVVAGLQALDQIIVTPPGESCPLIDGDLDGLGITRKGAESSAAWCSAVEEIEAGLQPDNVYTLCFWSASRFLDLRNAALTDLIPVLPAVPWSRFLDYWPPHFVFYVLQEHGREGAEPGEQGELRHLERNKAYILDMMMLAQSNSNLHLAKRYYFPEKSG